MELPSKKEFWDKRYGVGDYAYGKGPNEFFKVFIDQREPGRILLPAEGEGRNAAYAASRGWKVDAFDFSARGRQKALKLAAEQGVEINFQLRSFEEYPYLADHYDAVGLFYLHQPEPIRKFLHQKTVEALKPGGEVVLEYFSKEQIPRLSGGPKKEAMLGSEQMMREDFAGLDLVLLKKEIIYLDEGTYHQGEASVIRLIARKRTVP